MDRLLTQQADRQHTLITYEGTFDQKKRTYAQ
jgi:hypothetical protein